MTYYEKQIVTDQGGCREEGDWWLKCHLQHCQCPLHIVVGPAMQYDCSNLVSEGSIREQEVLHLISYPCCSTAGCCCGSVIQVSAEKAMMGIAEILHVGINITDAVMRRNTMRAFHFTVGHFISLNSVGSEKCMSRTHLFPWERYLNILPISSCPLS